jgi:cation:H+ antiporter
LRASPTRYAGGMAHPVVIFLGGLVVIILGAEVLVRGASRIAAMLGVKPIVIGLTVVAVGTSMPELAVGVTAVRSDQGPMAVANIAGTNIFNILMILGLSAAIRPLPLHLQSIRLDVPVMIGAAITLLLMALDGVISRFEGSLLAIASVFYFIAIVRASKKENEAVRAEFAEEYGPATVSAPARFAPGVWNAGLLVVGIALTILGADLLVAGAVDIARSFGVSEVIIGLTIVAIGTSAPELATTIMSTIRDDRDVAVGNLIGSSTTNILVILGFTAILAGGIDVSRDVLWVDLPLAAAVAIVCLPVFRSDRMVSRREGLFFFSTWLVYMGVLLWRAS